MAAVEKKAPTKKAAPKKTTTTKAPAKKAAEQAAPKAATKQANKKATEHAAPKKAAAHKVSRANGAGEKKPRIYGISFASVYPLYVQKAEKKGRTKEEVDQIIAWLTGYKGKSLERVLATKIDLETFFAQAPTMNPKANLITGVVCGVRVEDITDPVMQKIRYLDKLVDELAKGKQMASILRA